MSWPSHQTLQTALLVVLVAGQVWSVVRQRLAARPTRSASTSTTSPHDAERVRADAIFMAEALADAAHAELHARYRDAHPGA